ncbi:hypothetical protein Tsubulata_025769 [Turnera subulata]|uniref:DUF4378 domain-containing protein n=1 Tax=Turnera subulata TaxID=218843 RepID=A0A9Q0GEW5_9ROSI|nr:hypothetical protein Tsubulata_025769 [Turnera subulata]
MAIAQAKAIRQLKELLQEQQEPFILEIYLVERGYMGLGDSSVSPQKPSSCNVDKSRKGLQQHSSLLRAVFKQFISIKHRLRLYTSYHRDKKPDATGQIISSNQKDAGLDSFSSTNSTTVFCSSSDSDAEETSASSGKDHLSSPANIPVSSKLCNTVQQEVATEYSTEDRWITMENNERVLTPVTDIDNMPSHNYVFTTSKGEKALKNCFTLPKEVTEDSILSASLWKILFHSILEKPICSGVTEMQELVHFKSKMVLQKTKQLLFDCVKEIVMTQRRNEVQQQHEYLGSQDMGKLIGDKINSWVKQSGGESNLPMLLELDMVVSTPEWTGGYNTHRMDIALEIGDAILEDVKNETVMDVLVFMSSVRC